MTLAFKVFVTCFKDSNPPTNTPLRQLTFPKDITDIYWFLISITLVALFPMIGRIVHPAYRMIDVGGRLQIGYLICVIHSSHTSTLAFSKLYTVITDKMKMCT
jgi:hypothetical protein